jgi:hypothetical protein
MLDANYLKKVALDVKLFVLKLEKSTQIKKNI